MTAFSVLPFSSFYSWVSSVISFGSEMKWKCHGWPRQVSLSIFTETVVPSTDTFRYCTGLERPAQQTGSHPAAWCVSGKKAASQGTTCRTKAKIVIPSLHVIPRLFKSPEKHCHLPHPFRKNCEIWLNIPVVVVDLELIVILDIKLFGHILVMFLPFTSQLQSVKPRASSKFSEVTFLLRSVALRKTRLFLYASGSTGTNIHWNPVLLVEIFIFQTSVCQKSFSDLRSIW